MSPEDLAILADLVDRYKLRGVAVGLLKIADAAAGQEHTLGAVNLSRQGRTRADRQWEEAAILLDWLQKQCARIGPELADGGVDDPSRFLSD